MIRLFTCVILAFASLQPALAQGVFIPTQEAEALVSAQLRTLRDSGLKEPLLLLGNGERIAGKSDAPPRPLGRSGSLYAIALAHRLADAKVFNWSDRVDPYLPQAMKIKHPDFADPTMADLISHQGGFAQPSYAAYSIIGQSTAQQPTEMSRHIRRLRSPGRIASFDVTGLAVLVKAMEGAAGADFDQLLKTWVLAPLALQPLSLAPPSDKIARLCPAEPRPCLLLPRQVIAPIVGINAPPGDLVTLANAMISEKAGFLSHQARQLLTTAQWRINAQAPGWSAGLPQSDWAGRIGLDLKDQDHPFSNQIILFPGAGLVLYAGAVPAEKEADGNSARQQQIVNAALLSLVRQFVPPSTLRPSDEADDRAQTQAIAGRFARLEGATAWLGDRLSRRIERSALMEAVGPDRLAYDGMIYQRSGPRQFVNGDGQSLFFTTDPDGTIVQLEPGHGLLIKTGILSDPALVLDPAPIALIILLTAMIYGFVTCPPLWRRMGWMAVAGSVLFFIGLACELAFYHRIWLVAGNGFLIAFWRIAFNVGLMLLLTIPLFAIRFARTGVMPDGRALPLAAAHITVLSAASLYLLAVAVIWGLAGELWP